MFLLALALAPGLAICLYIIVKDQYNKEPKRLLVASFFFGALSCIPAAIFELMFDIGTFITMSILSAALAAYVIVALAEEGSKFLALRFFAFPRKAFDEPFDGIVYSVMVGMGFATLENIAYVLEHGFAVGIVRMFLSVPAHATFAVIMGYYMGEAKFVQGIERRYLMLKGLALAIFWHGTFDYCLFLTGNHLVRELIGAWLLLLGAIASFITAAILARKAIRKHIQLSKKMHQDKEQ